MAADGKFQHYDREENLDESFQSDVVMKTRFDTISL